MLTTAKQNKKEDIASSDQIKSSSHQTSVEGHIKSYDWPGVGCHLHHLDTTLTIVELELAICKATNNEGVPEAKTEAGYSTATKMGGGGGVVNSTPLIIMLHNKAEQIWHLQWNPSMLWDQPAALVIYN